MAEPKALNEIRAASIESVIQAGTIHGGVHHHYSSDAASRYRLDAVRPVDHQPRPDLPPSHLLAAQRGVVEFTGRDAELTELRRWRDGQGERAVLLIHGPGGQGKTRLATQFAEESAQSGWSVRVASHVGDGHLPDRGREEFGARVLVVVDYAERWPVDDLLVLVARLSAMPVRLLLVARSSDWWAAVRHGFADCGFAAGQLRLGPLASDASDRERLFDLARDRFAEVLGVPDAHLGPRPAGLAGDSFALVLSVHLAALVAVDAHRRGVRAPEEPSELSAYLLDRERAYWERLHRGGRVATRPATTARAVFTAILTRALPYREAAAVLGELGVSSPLEPVDRVLEDHARCYPATDPGTVLEPLYPDRLAEDFLALMVPGHDVAGQEPDAWAAAVPGLLVTKGPPIPAAVLRSTMTTLLEAAPRWPHLVEHQVAPLLRAHPQVALAGGGVLSALAQLDGLDPAVLDAVEAVLPAERHIDLDTGIADLTSRLTRHRLADGVGPAAYAALLVAQGNRSGYAGRHAEALAAVDEGLRVRRLLDEVVPGVLDPYLASALHSRAVWLVELGRWNEALASTDEAIDILRRTSDDRGAVHPGLPNLVAVLDHRATCLSLLGRDEEALATSEEVMRLVRDMRPVEEHVVAAHLHNLAVQLGELGRHEEAAVAGEEVVRVRRALVATRPEVYRADLALSLNNLAGNLSRLNRHDQAHAAAFEAVASYRDLVDINPASFRPQLVRALHTLGSVLAGAQRYTEALAADLEAVVLRRRLVEDDAVAHEPGLAKSLDNLTADLLDLGRPAEAVLVAQEAVGVQRRLVDRIPDTHHRGLADALYRLSNALAQAERYADALDPAREAVEVYRVLADRDPGNFQANLASAHNALANRLSKLNLWSASVGESQAAVRLLKACPVVSTDERDQLAATLGNLAVTLLNLERVAEAVSVAEEAVRITRDLTEQDPVRFQPNLVRPLKALGIALVKAGVLPRGLAYLGEAVSLENSAHNGSAG